MKLGFTERDEKKWRNEVVAVVVSMRPRNVAVVSVIEEGGKANVARLSLSEFFFFLFFLLRCGSFLCSFFLSLSLFQIFANYSAQRPLLIRYQLM